jgi:hypothetical protein
MQTRNLAVALLAAGLAAGEARADDDCSAPMSDWQPREAVQARAEAEGWVVRRIRTDDGCYEVYARDAQGNDIEAMFDPATLELRELETKFRRGEAATDLRRPGPDHGDEDEDDDDGGDDDDDDQDAAAPIAPAPVTPRPQGGILKATPKAVVE